MELVASRLSGLAPGTVAVIELLAAGEPLGVPVLEKITNPAGLEDAEARGFVQVYQDGRRTVARLAHPVYGEALRQSLPRSRLRRISATLASAIEATGARRREDLLRLGRWQLDSGAPGEPVLLSRAARRASEMFDMDLSARLAQAALDLGGGVDAGLVLGEARFRSGQHAEAEAVLAAMVPRCRTDAELARIASARAHNFHNLLGDVPAATAVLDEALAVITDPAPRLQLLGRLATVKVFEPDLEGALAAAAPLLDTDDDAMVSRGAFVSSIALALLGRGEEFVPVAYRGLDSHRRASGLVQLPEAQLIGAVFGHAAAGHLGRAEADARTGYQACLAAGDKEGMATHLFLAGLVRIEQGQLTRASKAFLDAASVNREIHDPAALRWCLAGLAMADAMSGHTDRAAAAAAVMQTDGGFCASGGPYVIAHQCSSSDIRLIMIGIFGALIAAGFYAGGSAGLGSKAASAGLILWAALFGTLGWNFVSVGRHSGASGMLFTGVLFLAMAVGGLIPLLLRLADDLRGPASRPSPVIPGMQPLVRAAVPTVPGLQPGPGTTFQPGTTATFQPGTTAAFQPGMLPVPGPVRGPARRPRRQPGAPNCCGPGSG